MSSFFYKNWVLYYTLLFFLIGWLIYSLLWEPAFRVDRTEIYRLEQELEDCRNEEITAVVHCNEEVQSGGKGRTETRHELGNVSGRIVIDYDMQNIPDQMEVYYDGRMVVSTDGLVSGEGKISFNYSADRSKPSFCTVVVSAPNDGTIWGYRVGCP